MQTVIPGIHVSPDTAFLIQDYPYGFRLRCQMRIWLEYNKTHGVRMMQQTTNPKKGNIWNKPKASTYGRFAAALYLDNDGHVHCTHLHEYMDTKQTVEWCDTFRDGVPEVSRKIMEMWLKAKIAYEARKNAA